MKQQRALLLPPGWNASLAQGCPQQYVASTHLYTWVKRQNGVKLLVYETTRWQGLDLKLLTSRSEVQHTNHYTTTPPHFYTALCLL